MPTLKITSVRTLNQNGNCTVFDPFLDALCLKMDVTASSDLLSLPHPTFEATFQVINPMTDTVIINEPFNGNLQWPAFWLSMGNNWGPPGDYDTPKKWGLHPVYWGWNDIFGFRGIIKAYTQEGESGTRAADAFDVSSVHWFMIRRTASL